MRKATLRNLFAHKLRLLLTALAVIIGVGFLAGTLIFTDTLKATFNDLVGRTSKNLSVVVRARSDFATTSIGSDTGRPLVPETLVSKVKALPGVKNAVGEVQGSDLLVTADGKAVLPKSAGPPTLAVSWTPSNFAILTFVHGRGPTKAGEVAIDQAAADDYHLQVGDTVTVQTQATPTKARIVGIVTVGGSSNLAGAVLSVFDPATAQQVAGKPGFVNQIDVEARAGVSEQALAARIGPTLPANYEAVTAKQVNKEQSDAISKALGFFNIFLLVFAGIALFVASFIILNTFTMLVAQRTRELALLRVIGASRAQVTRSVLGEALLVGVISSTIGLGVGALVAFGVRGLLDAFGISMPSGALVLRANTVIWAYVVGVLVTLIAALAPARRAARVAPIAALRDDVALPARSLRARALSGLAVVGCGAILMAVSISGTTGKAAAVSGAGILLVFVGVATLSPFASRPIVRVLAAPLVKVYGTPALLARSNAIRNPRRTASTAAALMIGLALVTTLSVIAASAKASVAGIVDRNLGADYVLTSSTISGFSPDVATRARAATGVQTVVEQRADVAHLDDRSVQLMGVSPDIDTVVNFTMKSGAFDTLGAGDLLVAKSTAKSDKLTVGNQVALSFPNGSKQSMRVGGVYADNALVGNYLVSLPVFAAHYDSQFDQSDYVLAASGQRTAAGDALHEALAAYPQVKIDSQSAFKDSITKQIDQLLGLMEGLLALALVIAVLGIVNTLALSVHERTREIGLLRAVGMSRRQLRRMVRLESTVIALFGALLGVGLGVLFGWAIVSTSGGQLTDLVFPIGRLAGFVIAAGVIGVLAALGPAWRAAKRPVLAAIAAD